MYDFIKKVEKIVLKEAGQLGSCLSLKGNLLKKCKEKLCGHKTVEDCEKVQLKEEESGQE